MPKSAEIILKVGMKANTISGVPAIHGQAVSISRISKQYGAVRAVEDVSIEVKAGEFLSLLGPSGSGKTTLLMMIAGFESTTEGGIRVGDRDLTYVPPNERGIGMVFQKYALFPHMTVAQNIAFPLRMRKFAKADIADRVERALALVRLDDYGHRMPSQLSGGQQQRIAVARAIVFEPPVLLMDEPLGALDKKLREQLQIEIKSLQQRLGVTVIYVTHDQEEALTMSDRVAVMNNGRLEQIGTPVDLYDLPNSAFVADFIGKMNFFDGEWSASGNGGTFRVGEHGSLPALAPGGESAAPSTLRPVRATVRPERLQLFKAGEGPELSLRGTIENVIFVGSHRTFLVRIGNDVFHVQIPADRGSNILAQGDAVDISCDPHSVRLFSEPAHP
jgi:mannopine transport system ATP-binding protein